jgi:hypothetical protein
MSVVTKLFQDICSYLLYLEATSFIPYLQMHHAAVPRDPKWYDFHSVAKDLYQHRCKIKRNHLYNDNFYSPHILHSINVNHSLTHSWSWALLKKLPIVLPLKNFPAFYGTRRFITAFTRALHWSLSWARLIQSLPSHPISLKIHFNIVHPPTSWSSHKCEYVTHISELGRNKTS